MDPPKMLCDASFNPRCFVFLVACALGCGSNIEYAGVSGVVKLDGEPIGPGRIMFVPNERAGTVGRAAAATFGEDGRFEIPADEETRLPPGSHYIVVQETTGVAAESGAAAEGGVLRNARIPPRYANIATSQLTESLEAGPNERTISLSRRP